MSMSMTMSSRMQGSWSLLLVPGLVALALWLLLFWDSLLLAAHTWYVSEIFSHGFFILPGVIYLIWRERKQLAFAALRPSYGVLALLLPILTLGVFGIAGGIQVFAQFSAFASLSLAVWLCVGHRVARQLWFPLLFLLFSVPVGEELVPALQHLTAVLAIEMLSWTSLPIYHSGLYIEIPQGKFVVAEACSGIRFFIGSLVFGAIYSHLTYRAFWRKCAFMLLAATVPILANAVRVFGIVLIGYFSDMEHATGADHLIYGWVFFAIVLVLLVLLGERFKDGPTLDHAAVFDQAAWHRSVPLMVRPLWLIALLLLTMNIWAQLIAARTADASLDFNEAALRAHFRIIETPDWQPEFKGASAIFKAQLDTATVRGVDVFMVLYASTREGSELISSQNLWYHEKQWSPVRQATTQAQVEGESWPIQVSVVQAPNGLYRSIAHVYVLPQGVFASAIKTKLAQTLEVVGGDAGAGAVIALSVRHRHDDFATVSEQLAQAFAQHGATLKQGIPW